MAGQQDAELVPQALPHQIQKQTVLPHATRQADGGDLILFAQLPFRESQAQPGGLGELTTHVKSFDLAAASRALSNLTQLANSPEVKNLSQSGIFGRETVNLVSDVAEAARIASRENESPVVKPRAGVIDTVKSVVAVARDPAVQRTVGFAVSFAHNLGVILARRSQQERAKR